MDTLSQDPLYTSVESPGGDNSHHSQITRPSPTANEWRTIRPAKSAKSTRPARSATRWMSFWGGRMLTLLVLAATVSVASREAIGQQTPTASFGSASYTATEASTPATISVTLSASPTTEVRVPITRTLRDGQAVDDDYTVMDSAGNTVIRSGDTIITLTFAVGAAGPALTQSFTLTATPDTSPDDGESLRLSIGGLPEGFTPGDNAVAEVTLQDIIVSLVATRDNDTAAENGQDGFLGISLSQPASVPVRIVILRPSGTDGGTADNSDFVISGRSLSDGTSTWAPDNNAGDNVLGTLTIPAGDSFEFLNIMAQPDNNDENRETVIFALGTLPPGTTADSGSRTATITIEDATSAPEDLRVVSFDQSVYPGIKGDTTTVTASLDRPPETGRNIVVEFDVFLAGPDSLLEAVSVQWTGMDDLQPGREDRQLLVFSQGESSLRIRVSIATDAPDGILVFSLLQNDEVIVGTGPARIEINDSLRFDARVRQTIRPTISHIIHILDRNEFRDIITVMSSVPTTSLTVAGQDVTPGRPASAESAASPEGTAPPESAAPADLLRDARGFSQPYGPSNYQTRVVTFEDLVRNSALHVTSSNNGDIGIESRWPTASVWVLPRWYHLDTSILNNFGYEGTITGFHTGVHFGLSSWLWPEVPERQLTLGVSYSFDRVDLDFVDRAQAATVGTVRGSITGNIHGGRLYGQYRGTIFSVWGTIGGRWGELEIEERLGRRTISVDLPLSSFFFGGGFQLPVHYRRIEEFIGLEGLGVDAIIRSGVISSFTDIDGGIYSGGDQRIVGFSLYHVGVNLVELELKRPVELGSPENYIEPFFAVSPVVRIGYQAAANTAIEVSGGLRGVLSGTWGSLQTSIEGYGTFGILGYDTTESGASVLLQYDYDPQDQTGLSVSVQANGTPSPDNPHRQEPTTEVASLLNRDHSPGGLGQQSLGLTSEISYGIGLSRGGLLTPYIGLGWRQEQNTTTEMGMRYRLFEGGPQLELSGEHRRSESSQEDEWRYRWSLGWNF